MILFSGFERILSLPRRHRYTRSCWGRSGRCRDWTSVGPRESKGGNKRGKNVVRPHRRSAVTRPVPVGVFTDVVPGIVIEAVRRWTRSSVPRRRRRNRRGLSTDGGCLEGTVSTLGTSTPFYGCTDPRTIPGHSCRPH